MVLYDVGVLHNCLCSSGGDQGLAMSVRPAPYILRAYSLRWKNNTLFLPYVHLLTFLSLLNTTQKITHEYILLKYSEDYSFSSHCKRAAT